MYSNRWVRKIIIDIPVTRKCGHHSWEVEGAPRFVFVFCNRWTVYQILIATLDYQNEIIRVDNGCMMVVRVVWYQDVRIMSNCLLGKILSCNKNVMSHWYESLAWLIDISHCHEALIWVIGMSHWYESLAWTVFCLENTIWLMCSKI